MSRIRPLPAAVLLLTMFASAGCGGDASGPGNVPGLGSFSAQVTGAVTRSLSGNAAFGGNILGLDGFAVAMDAATGDAELGFVKSTSGRPAVGSYTLGGSDSALYAELIVDGADGRSTFYISRSGQLQITTSTAQTLAGSATFTARNEFGSGEVQVNVTFSAICIPGGPFSCD